MNDFLDLFWPALIFDIYSAFLVSLSAFSVYFTPKFIRFSFWSDPFSWTSCFAWTLAFWNSHHSVRTKAFYQDSYSFLTGLRSHLNVSSNHWPSVTFCCRGGSLWIFSICKTIFVDSFRLTPNNFQINKNILSNMLPLRQLALCLNVVISIGYDRPIFSHLVYWLFRNLFCFMI